mgnify:FL=1
MSKKEVTKEKDEKEKVTKKVEKKETKKDVKKIEKKKDNKKKEKKVKKESFFKSVSNEMDKVRWPLKKEMVKYSIATLSFIIFFALFFTLGDLIIAGVKLLVR